MKIPNKIWNIKGKENGPNVVVLGGTHGDEVVGVEVIKKLLDFFDIKDCESGKTYESDLIKGNLFFGFGNPKAIKKKTRAAEDGPDLNRSFQIKDLNAEPSKNDRYDLIRARELFPILKEADYLFDLHSTHTPSVPFMCMGNFSSDHEDLYSIVPVKYILTDPDMILPRDVNEKELGTTDYIVNTIGGSNWSVKKYGKKKGIAFAYESGSKEDTNKVDSVKETVIFLLKKVGLLENKIGNPRKNKQEVYKLSDIVKSKIEGKFVFEANLKNVWSSVKKGDIIGNYPEINKFEIANSDGRLLFQKEKESFKKDEYIFYIAKRL
jgi:predicted deacylase